MPHDLFDQHMFEEMVDEAPAFAEMLGDLNQTYDYTDDMGRDVLMEFWQGDPSVRDQREMDPSRLANHAVASDIEAAPETLETRGFTKHDRYGATMATISVVDKIRETLENLPDDLEQQVEEAERQRQQAQQAAQALMQALANAMGAGGAGGAQPGDAGAGTEDDEDGSGGGSAGAESYQGEGPLTEEQQALADALAAAKEAAEESQADAEAATDAAQQTADLRAVQLAKPIREGAAEATAILAAEEDLLSHWGVEDGELQKMDFEARRKLVAALRNNRISKFLDLIGRFRQMVAAEQTHHVEYGRDEVYDTELSDRLPDVLGSEMVKLTNKHARLDFLNRLADRQLLSRKYRGVERVGKGALVFVGDVSGSMGQRDKHGVTREAWLKAFMMALLFQAKLQRRDFVVILFSSRNQQKMWTFPKGQAKIHEVIEVVEFFWNGGTDFMAPMDMATKEIERNFNQDGGLKADVIFATDDDAGINETWLRKYQEKRDRLGFRVFGISIGCYPGYALNALSTQARDIQEFVSPHDLADLVRML